MSRPRKPPRLYERKRKGRESVWVIRDGEFEISAGLGAGNRQAAETELARYIARKHKAKVGVTDPHALPIADVLTYYLEQKKPAPAADARALKAFDDLTLNVERLLEWWGDKLVGEIKKSNCRLYELHRTSQPNRSYKDPDKAPRISSATARRELEDLSAAIGAYHAEFALDMVPVVTLPDKAPPRKRSLSHTEAALCLWACLGWEVRDGRLQKIATPGIRKQVRARRKHLARFLLIGLYSGTRHMPIVRARWIPSTTEPYVDVDRGVLYRRGEEERETKKRQTPARIVPRLLAHLRRWRRADLARRDDEGEPVPVTHVVHMGGRPLTAKIRTAWEGMREHAGLGPEVVPHVMRHTSATWLMRGGAPLSEAADFLGMTEQTLRDNYYHEHPDFQDSVDGAFGRAKERSRRAPRNAPETPGTDRDKTGRVISLVKESQRK